MRLTFNNFNGEERAIASVENKEQAMQELADSVRIEIIKSIMLEVGKKNNIVHYDVGSWSEFFYLYLKEEGNE